MAQPTAPNLPPPPAHPAIEDQALAILKATSQRLAAAHAMSFTAVTTYESPARNGQPLYYATRSEVTMQRPDKLRVITPGDGPASDFFYDGTQMIAYDPNQDLAAISPAPPTLEATMQQALQTAAIHFPFAEVLTADPYAHLADGLTGAFVVGQSRVVGDTVTDMVALTTDRVQAEIWISVEDGLPRLIRAVYPNDPELPHYAIAFSDWKIDPPVTETDFTSAKALKAPRMAFARPDAPIAESKP